MVIEDNKKYLRLFDANLNRCREGLRVVEDTARFILDKDGIYIRARAVRHRLDVLTRRIYPELLNKRNSRNDPGRTIKEGERKSLKGVLSANFRRTEESLRVLEEYSRLLMPELGAELKKLRYKVYCLEKELLV